MTRQYKDVLTQAEFEEYLGGGFEDEGTPKYPERINDKFCIWTSGNECCLWVRTGNPMMGRTWVELADLLKKRRIYG